MKPFRTELAEDLLLAAAAIEIRSLSSFRIGNLARDLERGRDQPPGTAGDMGPQSTDALLQALAQDAYDLLFARQEAPPSRRRDSLARKTQLALLVEANTGRGTWDPGWTISGEPEDRGVPVEKNGIVFYSSSAGVRLDSAGLVPGTQCRVWVPAELRAQQHGFYIALGEADPAEPDELLFLIRLYWSLQAEGAPGWARSLIGALNEERVPFRLKVVSDPHSYGRAGSGQLLLEPGSFRGARDIVRQVYRDHRKVIEPKVPLMTLQLAPGLSIAEAPATVASFGRHRCALLAKAMVSAFLSCGSPLRSGEAREFVAAAFEEAGLDPARPHLAAGSDSSYVTMEVSSSHMARAARLQPELGFSEAACRIGDEISADAFWHADRCGWLGHRDRQDSVTGRTVQALTALEGDVYAGTAGVGLFLGALFARCEKPAYRRTAAGAIRQALWSVRNEPERYPPTGFYVGRLGVAWVARRVAKLVDEPELTQSSDDLLGGLLSELPDDGLLDVIRGGAGAIPVLLCLHQETNDSRFLDVSERIGGQLVEAAQRDGQVWSWSNEVASATSVDAPPLTGLAHGASGLGLALLELFAATGRSVFLDAARGAFEYERTLYDAERTNWPDLRVRPGARNEIDRPSLFTTAWCHGAPGITLARLRAIEIDPDRANDYKLTARAGLSTTLRELAERSREPDADTSLCHGICGLIEIAILAAGLLREAEPLNLARATMRRLVDRHAAARDWPSGALSRSGNPSLFLGSAGVGYTLLRLGEHPRKPPHLPTPLLPGGSVTGR